MSTLQQTTAFINEILKVNGKLQHIITEMKYMRLLMSLTKFVLENYVKIVEDKMGFWLKNDLFLITAHFS